MREEHRKESPRSVQYTRARCHGCRRQACERHAARARTRAVRAEATRDEPALRGAAQQHARQNSAHASELEERDDGVGGSRASRRRCARQDAGGGDGAEARADKAALTGSSLRNITRSSSANSSTWPWEWDMSSRPRCVASLRLRLRSTQLRRRCATADQRGHAAGRRAAQAEKQWQTRLDAAKAQADAKVAEAVAKAEGATSEIRQVYGGCRGADTPRGPLACNV